MVPNICSSCLKFCDTLQIFHLNIAFVSSPSRQIRFVGEVLRGNAKILLAKLYQVSHNMHISQGGEIYALSNVLNAKRTMFNHKFLRVSQGLFGC